MSITNREKVELIDRRYLNLKLNGGVKNKDLKQ